MSTCFRIDSAADGSWLELRADQPQRWTVVLSGPNTKVESPVYAYSPHASFADLFRRMAESWMGWDGAKTYESLEGEFSLTCTHDGVGRVTIVVEIHTDHPAGAWCVRGQLVVEPGQLAELADAAGRFTA